MRAIKTIALGCFLASTAANAAIVTQFGTDVSFTYDDATLFGTGNVVGNSIAFLPTNFKAESLDGAGTDTTAETLNVTIMATNPAFVLDTFQLAEFGDYRLKGTPLTTDVDASAFFNIVSQTTTCGVFACSSNAIFTAGALADTGGALTNWSLGGVIDLDGTAGWGADTKVTVQVQDNLLAKTTLFGEIASIQKKQGGVGIIVNAVPVPSAVWLLASGLLGLIGISRRRLG